MSSEITVFDRAAFLDRLQGDREIAAYILEVFISELPGLLAVLLASCQAGDLEAAARQAHSIKGSAANVGAEVIKCLAVQAEKACEQRELKIVAELVGQMESALQDFRRAVAGDN